MARAACASHDPSWFSIFRINERLVTKLPRRALLPRRRCRAHPFAGRRAGHEHRHPGCGQSRLEAGLCPARRRQHRGCCSTATRPSGGRSPAAVIAAAAQKQHLSFGASKLTSMVRNMAVSIFGNHSGGASQVAGRIVGNRIRLSRRSPGRAGRRQAPGQAHRSRDAGPRSLVRRCGNRQERQPVALSLGAAPQPADLRGGGSSRSRSTARCAEAGDRLQVLHVWTAVATPAAKVRDTLSDEQPGLGAGASRPGRRRTRRRQPTSAHSTPTQPRCCDREPGA